MSEIKNLKSSLKKEKIRGLALDIDETLSFTTEYWVSELSKNFGNPKNLSAREIFQQYRLIQNFPHWQTKEATAWMEWARSSNKIQENLPLIVNSNHVVNKINTIIAVACYLTVRPQTVVSGTKHWLEKHNFPRAEVIARPEEISYEMGTKWKAKALLELYPQVLGIVDDNPSLINYLPKNYKGFVFLYDFPSFISKSKNVIVCPTWEDVLAEVSEVFS